MPSQAQPAANGDFSLTTEYTTPYNAVIRSDIVMGVPRYFLERWLPVLGPDPAALVNTLRQLDYRSEAEGVTISGEALAREAGMSRRHLYTCLAAPWVAAFVRTISGERVQASNGTLQQQANHYLIRMDDPLAPADADHLLGILTRSGDTPLAAAQRALEIEPRALWAPNPAEAPKRFPQPRALTARDVLARAFPAWKAGDEAEQQAFNEAADALHRHITLVRGDGRTSKIIVPQYFRQRWWKRLGHDLAWSYLWLRGFVYDNPAEGIQRDTCWVPALETLLSVIGRPREWWRRNVENARASGEGWALSDFFRQTDAQKGRDPAHPQWVARQFVVALQVPIAPEDRARYAALLTAWPEEGIPSTGGNGSATPGHTGEAGVRHAGAHRLAEGPPHSDTPDYGTSATDVHTGEAGVCHTGAQGSATPAHRESESHKQAPSQTRQASITSSTQGEEPAPPAAAAAAETDPETERVRDLALIDQIAAALETTPDLPLWRAASAPMWLAQAWPEPVRPHTPAWLQVAQGAVSPRDLVALMLAIWADSAIQQPPRYLSWVIQRWQALPEAPPVDRWAEWQALAEMPVQAWMETGAQAWQRMITTEYRALPFGLDALVDDYRYAQAAPEPRGERTPRLAPEPPGEGLDERPGGGTLTIRDIWIATLGELRVVMNPSAFQMWLAGATAVSYVDGVLTVRARHAAARDELATRLHKSLEASATKLAGQPVAMRFVAEG